MSPTELQVKKLKSNRSGRKPLMLLIDISEYLLKEMMQLGCFHLGTKYPKKRSGSFRTISCIG